MDGPEGFGLVAEVGVGVEGGEEVGEDAEPEVLSEEAVCLEESAEAGEDGDDNVLPGELVDGEAECGRLYMLKPLKAIAAC